MATEASDRIDSEMEESMIDKIIENYWNLPLDEMNEWNGMNDNRAKVNNVIAWMKAVGTEPRR
jgi:hypothetical protein